jgi:hypothetical protein
VFCTPGLSGGNGSNGSVGYAVQTAVNGGFELLIFVPRTARSHDLRLSFRPGTCTGPWCKADSVWVRSRDLRQASYSQARNTFQLINTAPSAPVMNGVGPLSLGRNSGLKSKEIGT